MGYGHSLTIVVIGAKDWEAGELSSSLSSAGSSVRSREGFSTSLCFLLYKMGVRGLGIGTNVL